MHAVICFVYTKYYIVLLLLRAPYVRAITNYRYLTAVCVVHKNRSQSHSFVHSFHQRGSPNNALHKYSATTTDYSDDYDSIPKRLTMLCTCACMSSIPAYILYTQHAHLVLRTVDLDRPDLVELVAFARQLPWGP